MKVLQINTVCNSGSTGRIAEEIGKLVIAGGGESYIAYGRGKCVSKSNIKCISTVVELYLNALLCRFFDNDGFASYLSTRRLIKYIDKVKPDLIHLHNLHGYYINLPMLCKHLKQVDVPIVWTLHDCWVFTGHCTHFDYAQCNRWKTGCYQCPLKHEYPGSYLFDSSRTHYTEKKTLISSLNHLHFVTPSKWLMSLLAYSFCGHFDSSVINNGVDLKSFKPTDYLKLETKYKLQGKRVILGVAGRWMPKKGLHFFESLAEYLSEDTVIVIVGLDKSQIRSLYPSILGIERTENVQELAALYSRAGVFVNPTLEDNFPTTNLEAMSCGTPVVTFATGGSVESVDESTGLIVPQGDVLALKSAVDEVLRKGKSFYYESCIEKARQYYNAENKFQEYISLYNNILK